MLLASLLLEEAPLRSSRCSQSAQSRARAHQSVWTAQSRRLPHPAPRGETTRSRAGALLGIWPVRSLPVASNSFVTAAFATALAACGSNEHTAENVATESSDVVSTEPA